MTSSPLYIMDLKAYLNCLPKFADMHSAANSDMRSLSSTLLGELILLFVLFDHGCVVTCMFFIPLASGW